MAKPSVILTTFAGRKDRMELLVEYAKKCISRGIISEYHIWNYARKDSDSLWVNSLHDPSCGLRVFQPSGKPYHSYYQHYDRETFKDTVFVKADDDIVYLDINRFKDFIRFRVENRELFLVSANVVNNGVCAYFQQLAGSIPKKLMDLPYPPDGFCGTLWESAALAESLHRYFLNHRGRFAKPGTVIAPDRISINFISYLGEDLDEVRTCLEDDEHLLSVEIPQRLGRKNAIFNSFVVSHLSFFSQEEGMNTSELLNEYRNLQHQIFKSPPRFNCPGLQTFVKRLRLFQSMRRRDNVASGS